MAAKDPGFQGSPPSTIKRPDKGFDFTQAARTQARVPGSTNLLARTTAAPNDAQAFLTGYLNKVGLPSLAGWAWNRYTQLGGGQAAMDQINLELPDQQAYRDRFAAISMREKAGLPQLTPAQYLQYEASLDNELALVGAPAAIRAGTAQFRDIVTKGLAGDVSINEMQARIEGGYAAVRDAHSSVRDWFGQKFGVQGDQALAAYFLAPEHSEATLARMEREAEIGGAAGRAGINVGVETAGQVAAINPQGDVSSQMQRLAELAPLFSRRVGDAAAVTTDQGVAAEFGLDATSAAALQRALEERKAAGSGGTAITADNTGLTGVGTAR